MGCIRGDENNRQPSKPTKGTVEVGSVELVFADGQSIDTEGYDVLISGEDGRVEARGLLGDLSNVSLSEGEYQMTISSMTEVPVAEWNTPYYVATTTLTVEAGAATQIGKLTAELQNIGVRVEFTDRFREVMDSGYSVEVTLGLGRLTYRADESRTGYFRATAEKQMLTAVLTGHSNGQPVSEQRIVKDVTPGEVKVLTFDIKEQEPEDNPPVDPEPEEGGAKLDFVVDVTVGSVDINGNITVDENDREPAEGDGEGGEGGEDDKPIPPVEPDKPQDLGVPTIVWEGHDLSQWFELTSGDITVALNIAAPNKIKTLVVDIVSDAAAFQKDQLQGVGLDSHLDLSNPGALRGAIEGLGFPVAENVVGKTELVFDISSFMPMMIVANGKKVEFKLTLTDEFGHEVVTSLKLNVKLN